MSDLEQKSLEIEKRLMAKLDELKRKSVELADLRAEAAEDYRKANTTDRSENAELDAAISKMKEANADTIKNEKQINLLSNIEDLSRYNSVGIVVLYSTVRLECEGVEYIFRIFPDGISYVEDGIIALNSRLASALMGKVEGDVVNIMHSGKGTNLEYKIKEIF